MKHSTPYVKQMKSLANLHLTAVGFLFLSLESDLLFRSQCASGMGQLVTARWVYCGDVPPTSVWAPSIIHYSIHPSTNIYSATILCSMLGTVNIQNADLEGLNTQQKKWGQHTKKCNRRQAVLRQEKNTDSNATAESSEGTWGITPGKETPVPLAVGSSDTPLISSFTKGGLSCFGL